MTWCIAMRRGKRGRLALTEMAALLEGCKASVRAKVEHGFFYIRRLCGYRKVRYRGLGKNENRLALLLGFVNLLRAESCLAWLPYRISVPEQEQETENGTRNQGIGAYLSEIDYSTPPIRH